MSDTPVQPDVIQRMQADVRRAAAKPASHRRWVMVIDLRRCIGCHACTVGCVAENKLPPGVVYRPVIEEEAGRYPNVTRKFLPRPCMHCDEPPCTKVCPVGATEKDRDGLVKVDYEECIGCRSCVAACPYGARTFDFGELYVQSGPQAAALVGKDRAAAMERSPSFEYGKAWKREGDASPVGNARKCHFCEHRLSAGMLPACVTTCVGRATLFGDANDPDSVVSRLVALPNSMRLKEELGTEPRVFYLV
jgi:molybdopterin-containing oxidoreductase family iron-sulfur binding subunit